ncbi:MAG: 7-carboxy-7-deazaguanine synthase QueE [Gammaproteobacteria bacterium]|nr:MAG: 7-carboxy-7-deazaguanine synthase QueE [Gammaproteobacteria bacterium]
MALPAENSVASGEEALSLKVTEIFYSLQGESTLTGLPTVFIRLTGCPLRCQYCDTEYAFHGGKNMTLKEIQQATAAYSCNHVLVTGGEPLAQKNCLPLLQQLCNQGYQVALETSGARPIEEVDPRVTCIMDIKTPGSGESDKNRYENIEHLKRQDQIKFVICHRKDYEWSLDLIHQWQLANRCELLFSPSKDQLNPVKLAEWILEDHAPVRMQIQLHKLLWGDTPGK